MSALNIQLKNGDGDLLYPKTLLGNVYDGNGNSLGGALEGIQNDLDSHGHVASEIEGLSQVATTGAYGDLTGKPTIPTAASDIGAAAATHSHTGYAQMLTFTNKTVSVSAWSSSTTYAGYGFRASVSCSGIDSTWYADVVLNPADASSGNFAAVSQTGTNIVHIYCKEKPTATLTIPTIVCMKVV